MRVLWLTNIMLPAYAKAKSLPYSEKEGWLSGAYERIALDKGSDITLGVCFPVQKGSQRTALSGTVKKDVIDGVEFFPFEEDTKHPERYDKKTENLLHGIIDEFKPDAVHIFGTEYPHTLAMARAFGKPERTLISFQGVITECANVYRALLPGRVWNRATFRDIVKRDSLKRQKQKFEARAEHEREALELVHHISGRTEFDRHFTHRLCPDAVYHHMNETLRSCFYDGEWAVNGIERHSIFVSQGDYPLKGFHILLRAMPDLLKRYPDLHVYCAGINIFDEKKSLSALKISSYGKYLKSLIKKYALSEHVTMTGVLDAPGMKEHLLKANVFVIPSVMENSPNSMGEAMLLGCPVVAAKAGGIPSMLEDGKEGVIAETGSTSALASAIGRIFDDDSFAASLGKAAKKRALKTHDADANYRRLLVIYKEILKT